MGAYYRDVVVVIELGAYIHGVLTFSGCLLSRFYGISLSTVILYSVHTVQTAFLLHKGKYTLQKQKGFYNLSNRKNISRNVHQCRDGKL